MAYKSDINVQDYDWLRLGGLVFPLLPTIRGRQRSARAGGLLAVGRRGAIPKVTNFIALG